MLKMPNTRIGKVIFVLLCVFTASGFQLFPANSTSAADVIANVRQALNTIKPFSVSFVQQVYTDKQVDLQESGDIIFKDHNQLKWTYREPDYKVFLLNGDDYKFYDEDNEQLTLGKVKDKSQQWIWQLLFSDDIIPDSRWEATTATLHIVNSKQDVNIHVTVDRQFIPIKVTQEDAAGARMVYLFNGYRKNITIPPDTFELKIPPEVEVIQDEPR